MWRFLAVLLLSSGCLAMRHESMQLRVSQSAVDYINTEIRNVIPTIESELQNFPLPEVSKQNTFRLHDLKLQSSSLGSSSIQFQNGGVRFGANVNRFDVGGRFWVKVGFVGINGKVTMRASNVRLDVQLDFNHGQVTSVAMKQCRLNMDLKIELYNPILNFIVGAIYGATQNQARALICNALRDQAVPAVNRALKKIPTHYDIGNNARVKFVPGSASVNSQRFLTSSYASVQPRSGDVNWSFREVPLPTGGYTEQCCIWISEYILNSALATLVPASRLQTSFDVAKLTGGDLGAPLSVEVENSAAPLVYLTPTHVHLTTPVNVSLIGEQEDGTPIDLGHYSTDYHMSSETKITDNLDELKRSVEEKLQYKLPEVSASDGKNPVEYLLNEVLPTKEYVTFYNAHSDVIDGASRTCGKFRPTQKTRDLVHQLIRQFLRSNRARRMQQLNSDHESE